MWSDLIKNAPAIATLFSVLAIVGGGTFSFVQWLDVRRREQRQQRWTEYSKLLPLVAGEAKIPVQMAALFQLAEFKEFSSITISTLEATDQIESEIARVASGKSPWTEYITPHTRKVISLLKSSD